MQNLVEAYRIPRDLVALIERRLLVPLRESPESRTVEFHIPSKRTTDRQGRITTWSVTWVHPAFKAEFCQYYDRAPGDRPNFHATKETTDLGDDIIEGLHTEGDLLEWLIDLSNSEIGQPIERGYPLAERAKRSARPGIPCWHSPRLVLVDRMCPACEDEQRLKCLCAAILFPPCNERRLQASFVCRSG
jgi:hypothetical protein